MWPKLIIFDFDGVLADSELLACGVVAAYATELGAPMTVEEAVDQFVGRRALDVQASVEQRIGHGVTNFANELHSRTVAAFDMKLEAVIGADAFLRRTSNISRCIASSSSHERLQLSLRRIGLDWAFHDNIFSADDVERGKPFPDLFLYAASQMGTPPRETLVIEDSVSGVQAGVAARMTVAGLLAGSHIRSSQRSKLERAGAEPVVLSYSALAVWLDNAKPC